MLSVLLLLAVAQPAPSQTLAISARVIGSDASGATELIVESAARAASFALSIEVMRSEEMHANGVAETLRRCGTAAECATALRETRATDRALIIAADLRGGAVLVTSWLLDATHGQIAGRELDERAGTTEDAAALAAAHTLKLLEAGGFTIGGFAIVEANVPGASIAFDDQPVGEPGPILLAPGRHRLLAAHEGCGEARAEIEIARGRETRIPIVLEASSSTLQSPWFWGAVGGAAAIGIGVAVAIAARPAPFLRPCLSHDGNCNP